VSALVNVVTGVGLVTACLVLVLAGLYALQLGIRVLRHWDTRKAPPELKRGSLLGQEIELAPEASAEVEKALAKLERRMKRLERKHARVLLILKRDREREE
jgi:uncharacterized membrane protein YciS (DUF1049 family)